VIRRRLCAVTAACLAAATVSCAPKLVSLPGGPGTVFAEAASAYAQAIERCRDIRTFRAVIGISGRAAGNRFRASVDAGFERPDKVRLELPAPGKPIFTFVAAGGQATLLLAREGRVLRDAPPAATLEALAGVAIDPAELLAIVAGCGFGAGQPEGGRAFDRGWAAVDVRDTVTYLRQVDGRWQIAAATRGPLEVHYLKYEAGAPVTIRLRAPSTVTGAATDLTIRPSQVDINEALAAEVFLVDIPPETSPLTLDELRQAGPLGR